MRRLYRLLVLLHPPAFQRRFGAEMLVTFAEAAKSASAAPLLYDAFVSVARQWLLRSGSWKLATAMAGAGLEIMAGGLIFLCLKQIGGPGAIPASRDPGLEDLMRFIVVAAGGLVVMVAATAIWMRNFLIKRNRHPRLGR